VYIVNCHNNTQIQIYLITKEKKTHTHTHTNQDISATDLEKERGGVMEKNDI
jgi:hypothetical protein